MKTLLCVLLPALLLSAPLHAEQGNGNMEAYSRIFRHKDGTRTESYKNGDKNQIEEFTYNKSNILIIKRLFITDSKGRCRQGYIFDGQKHPKGSIQFGYSKDTDQLMEERQFNEKGQLVRWLLYPGALKKTIKGVDLGNRFVAFNYDPNDPTAKPVLEKKEIVKPTRPVESDQDDFDPQIPMGRSVPAANAASASSAAASAPSAPPAPSPAPVSGRRKSFFGGGGTAPAAPPQAMPAPPPAATPKPAPVPNPPRAVQPATTPAGSDTGKKPAPVPARKPQT